MMDYDGTLAPFHAERHRATPYPAVMSLLREIMDTGRTSVVIVSGRDANDILPFLGFQPPPEIWGLHGFQRRRSNGSIEIPNLDERTQTGLSDAQRWLAYQGLQHAAELKHASVAVHWRGLDDRQAEEWRGRVLLGWNTIAQSSGLRLLEFDGGVEICARETDKGAAVRALLSDVDSDTPASFLGDDITDECAFRALGERGLSVLVRPRHRKTSAQIWIQPPDDLLEFLRLWLEASHGERILRGKPQATVNR
jgi:trehalose 6-phosphate phosphatase